MIPQITGLVDFGLVVLVWIVQLVVYPGFRYYSIDKLLEWHSKYTVNITFVVLPLMVSQLVLYGISTWQDSGIVNLIELVMVVATWGITFAFAVPLHNRISKQQEVYESVDKLVSVNWYRTFLWTLIFLVHFFEQ